MNPIELRAVSVAVNGEMFSAGHIEVRGVAADSGAVKPGDLFVAIPGERVDGHDYTAAAMAAGAVAVLAQKPVDAPYVLVSDTVKALGELAHSALSELVGLDVVAVTGSSGKTTTKDLMAAVFAKRGDVVAPVGSFNTEVGMPLTVLGADSATRTLVLEMGARGIGHVAYLCQIAVPDVSVVLNIGSAHVGEFGGKENIAEAKSEIVKALLPGGTAVLNADDPLVRAMQVPKGVERLTFGEGVAADVRIVDLSLDELARPSFTLTHRGREAAVSLNLSGEHNAQNAAAVAGAALSLGMDLTDIAAALSSASARSKWRMEVTETGSGVVVINDSYNANPESVRAALKSLVEIGRTRGARTWAVLGEMRELGPESLAEHDSLGRMAVRLDVSRLVAVGEGARPIHLGAFQEGSWADESVWVPNASAASELLAREVRSGDIVLVKASRAVGLETVAEDLLAGGSAE